MKREFRTTKFIMMIKCDISNRVYRAAHRMALLHVCMCLYMFNQNLNKSEHMAGVFICLFAAAAASLDSYRYW